MVKRIRGADLIAQSLDRAGMTAVFTLSGNHVMPIFDASIGTSLEMIHTRHEAATVYMADAWARLSGKCGVALVSSGAGHSNAVGSLATAQGSDSPVILLSGHAGLNELGRGAFQEMRQADIAAPSCKLSRTATSAATLGHELAECVRVARSGRPGPVHLSLPVDLLNTELDDAPDLWPDAEAFEPEPLASPSAAQISEVVEALRAAERPILITGPWLCRGPEAKAAEQAADALRLPLVGMDAPRGIIAASLGHFSKALAKADLIVLLGKPHDQTIRFGQPPFVDAGAKFVVVDPDPAMIARARKEQGDRVAVAIEGDPLEVLQALAASGADGVARPEWTGEVRAAVSYRPDRYAGEGEEAERVHPADLCRAIDEVLAKDPDAILFCDGGEIPQWPQAIQRPNRRVLNGVSASIGGVAPFAIGARSATGATCIAVSGDGGFGFHLAEMDTALRHGLPVVVVVGNDATWNAEHQIQIRTYGAARAHGCELLPTRYDRVVEALGGHGEHVTRAEDLVPAIERAIASGLPACVNVEIRRMPAPIFS